MKKRLIGLLCIACCWQIGWTQNSVGSIQKRYAQQKAYIANYNGNDSYNGADWAEYHHLKTRQFLPGTGGHEEDLYLYWDKVERSEQAEDPDIYPLHCLTFATKKYNYAAREFYEEYMYDQDGQPAFIYGYDMMWAPEDSQTYEPYEFRFYLNKEKLIKVIIKKRAENQQAFTVVYSGTTLKKEYEEAFNTYLHSAKAISKFFLVIEKETYNY